MNSQQVSELTEGQVVTEPDSHPKTRTRKAKPTLDASFVEFAGKFAAAPSPEDKIHLALQYMRSSLSQEGSPRFKEFWEARGLCLPLFRENINSLLRGQLWSEFLELSQEANRLKDILAEQAIFAVEQIDLAIKAFEEDLQNYDRLLGEMPHPALPEECKTLAEKKESYAVLQRELNWLNALASRINSLRKELLKTEMRIRDKNRFFKRLSEAGDKVFPRRKELIQKISDEFLLDVDQFIKRYFAEGKVEGAPFYVLREEIKALQNIAKILTLNTHAFTQSRLTLSSCWDQIKVLEKERKKEIASKKQTQTQNKSVIQEKIKAFQERAADRPQEEKKREWDEIVTEMRAVDLSREDVTELRRELDTLKASVFPPKEPPRKVQQQPVKEKVQPANDLKDKISALIQSKDLSIEELEQEYNALKEQASDEVAEQLLGTLQDILLDRKEKSLLDERTPDALEKLQELLLLRKEIRQEIKSRLERYRKTLGSSGFNFEKAMVFRELVDREKERFDKISESIEQLEEKLLE